MSENNGKTSQLAIMRRQTTFDLWAIAFFCLPRILPRKTWDRVFLWSLISTDAPFEQLPLLEIDGGKKTLSESLSIMRYLSKTLGQDGEHSVPEVSEFLFYSTLSGFIGKTKTDSAKVDMFAYACNDLYIPIYFYQQAKSGNEGVR